MSNAKSNRFPFFVDITGWKVLVVGGGSIALRRIKVLRSFGASITMICPEPCDELLAMAQQGDIRWIDERFEGDIPEREEWKLVLAITDDDEVNHHITAAARSLGILVNNAADQTDCDFFFPAIIEGSGVTIGLVSDGSDHGHVRKVAAKIREEYGE